MFRIRRIYGDSLPLQLANPMKYSFKSILFVADGQRGDVKGFALLQHAPDVGFCYLDYISIEARCPGDPTGYPRRR